VQQTLAQNPDPAREEAVEPPDRVDPRFKVAFSQRYLPRYLLLSTIYLL
jgi:hypothetical protein